MEDFSALIRNTKSWLPLRLPFSYILLPTTVYGEIYKGSDNRQDSSCSGKN